MVGQVLWGRVLFLEQIEHAEEFKDAAWPAMVEGDRECILLLGEQGNEMDVDLDALIVLDRHGEVGVGVDAVFLLAPVEARSPFFFGVGEPLTLHAIVTACIGVLKGWCSDG